MRLAWAFAIAFFATGCGTEDDGRQGVSGTIKLKTKPIKDGALVEFADIAPGGSAASAMTVGGAFTIPKANGLKPGKYLVRVTLGDGKTAVNPVNEGAPPGPGGGTNIISKDIIPADWGRNSKQQVTVTKDGPNEFKLDIP